MDAMKMLVGETASGSIEVAGIHRRLHLVMDSTEEVTSLEELKPMQEALDVLDAWLADLEFLQHMYQGDPEVSSRIATALHVTRATQASTADQSARPVLHSLQALPAGVWATGVPATYGSAPLRPQTSRALRRRGAATGQAGLVCGVHIRQPWLRIHPLAAAPEGVACAVAVMVHHAQRTLQHAGCSTSSWQ